MYSLLLGHALRLGKKKSMAPPHFEQAHTPTSIPTSRKYPKFQGFKNFGTSHFSASDTKPLSPKLLTNLAGHIPPRQLFWDALLITHIAVKMLDPSTGRNSAADVHQDAPRTRKRFVSYRLRGDMEKPWLKDPKFKRTKFNNWIIWGFVALGVAIAGLVAFLQIRGSLPTEVSTSSAGDGRS